MDAWDSSLKALKRNLRTLLAELRDDGITGMSRGNIRQIVSTRGVTVPPSMFDRLLDRALAESVGATNNECR